MAINLTEASLYGVGRGEAAVWGSNKALDELKLQQKQDQLRRAKEDAELQDQVAKVNIDAARNEDLPEIMQRYGTIKSTFAKMRGTTNSQERIKLQAELNEQKAELSRAVNVSKTVAGGLKTIGDLRLTHADQLSDDFASKYTELSKLSSFDPRFGELSNDLSNNAMAPKFDVQKYSKGLADKSVKKVAPTEQMTYSGGLKRVERVEGQHLDADNILNNAASDYKNDKEFRRFINYTYKDVPADEAVKKYAAEVYTTHKDAYDEVKKVNVASQWDQRSAPMSQMDKWRIAHGYDPKKEGRQKTQGEIEATDRQDLIEGMWKGVAGTGERVNAEMVGRGGYDGGLKITKQGSKMAITVPSRTATYIDGAGETKSKVFDSRTVVIDKNNPADKFKLSALVSEITGEKITATKFNTTQGKSKKLINPAGTTAPKQPASAPAPKQSAPAKADADDKVQFIMPNGDLIRVPKKNQDALLKKFPKAKRA